jgi:hypothetical protein
MMPKLHSDPRHETMHQLANRLEGLGIAYAILSAEAFGGRSMEDRVEVLLTGEGLNRFREELGNVAYRQVRGHSRSFVDGVTNVPVEVRMTGHHPGIRGPGPIKFPNPAEAREEWGHMQVVPLTHLIQLKLAARRHYDSGDVVSLIRARQLDESFAEKLHPAVRADYFKCLDEKRREDEFDALG